MATVEQDEREAADRSRFTYYPAGWPVFPMPQLLDRSRDDQRVVVSCLVSDLRFEWRLGPVEDGRATHIAVFVEIPQAEAERLETQRDVIRQSPARLADLAARTQR